MDLANAYETILKLLLTGKLHNEVYGKLAHQLKIFLFTVCAKVNEDIKMTGI